MTLTILLLGSMVKGQGGKFYLIPDSSLSTINYNLAFATSLTTFNDSLVINGIYTSNKNYYNTQNTYLANIDKGLTNSNIKYLYEDSIRVNSHYEITSFAKDTLNNNLYNLAFFANWFDTINNGHRTGVIYKYDSNLNQTKYIEFGDSAKTTLPNYIYYYDNSIYVSGSRRLNAGIAQPSKYYLAKFDTSLNLLWEKELNGASREYSTSLNFHNNHFYISGYDWLAPYSDEKFHNRIKKVDTAGNVVLSNSLPFKINEWFAFSLLYEDLNLGAKIISASAQNANNSFLVGSYGYPQLKLNYIDTQLNIYKTKIIQLDKPIVINNMKKVSEDKILIVGSKYVDTIGADYFLGAWACLLDTAGNLIWERTYEIRKTHHFLYDGLLLDDTTFVFSGTVYPFNLSTQDALLIKADINGCMDTVNCYPLTSNNFIVDKPNIKVYPNPASNNLVIEIGGKNYLKSKLCIYDMLGKSVAEINDVNNINYVNTSAWQNGMYLIKYFNNSYTHTYKLIKQ